ncbi:GGDEF domain-containing protein [Paenibacillus albicereus]|uniref:GGDEF domain-containing protein n=1 Tax=Paenibacillus albicereus TaxID=2726185 RepID=A0A6H2GX41_9BACL|nr:diguanylate cyclase [Paenibacillus albicereus]QJC51967.1 GGDEF domain-containing protein [Paenibacillus albicereus]
MEVRKLDIWVIILAVLSYGMVNWFVLLPKDNYLQNTLLLSALFAVAVLSYLSGLMIALTASAVCIFFYGSYVMYGSVMQGKGIESQVYYWLVLLPLVAVLTAVIGSLIRSIQQENVRMRERYSDFVTIDETTGLENARVFYAVLSQFMSLSRRYELPLSVMLVRLDYYDDIRSIVGGEAMKDVVAWIGKRLGESTRSEDSSYILEDGRTFALLLLGDREGAQVVKSRIKESIYAYDLQKAAKAVTVRLELRVGVAAYDPSEPSDPLALRRAAEKDMEYDV